MPLSNGSALYTIFPSIQEIQSMTENDKDRIATLAGITIVAATVITCCKIAFNAPAPRT